MPYDDRLSSYALLKAFTDLATGGSELVSSSQLADATGASLSAVKRMLSRLAADRRIDVTGKARATRYRLLPTDAPGAAGQAATHLPATAAPAGAQRPPDGA